MPDGMIQKERKKRIIKQAAMKAILVIILVCIAMITFLLLFQVRKIEVSGNQYLSRQEIADWVQDDNWSSNSLYVMIRNHLMNHELLPAMEEANVTMKNPWTVKVTTKEKRVAGYIVSGDECIYFDKDGIVLAKTKELWDGIPCIEGLEVKKVQLYKELPVSKANKKAFGNLLDMTMTLKKCDLAPDKIVCSVQICIFFLETNVSMSGTRIWKNGSCRYRRSLRSWEIREEPCIWKILTQIILQLPSKKM